MGPGLLQKRNCPAVDASSLDLRLGSVDSNASRAGSKVWSEIRGAIRALGKSGRNDSESSTVLAWKPDGTQTTREKGKAVVLGQGREPARRAKGLMPKDLVRKLGLHEASTVVQRDSPLKARVSLQAHASSDSSSTVSSDSSSKMSTPGNESTRKTSVDSRFSDLTQTKDTPKRRRSRRRPWSKSSPDGGTLQTIEESSQSVQPTILTVERAAAAKIYLELYFNELLNKPSARCLRRQLLESQLYCAHHLTGDQKEAIRRSFQLQETCHVRETRVLGSRSVSSLTAPDRPVPHIERYQPVKVLGRGSFGVVKLVRDTSESSGNQVLAMKVIRKSDMLRSNQEGHLRAERDFLVASEGSDWIVPLVASFQDPKNLYLVMEYMPGGDFLGLLIRENVLHESVARFYIAEMILAVEEAHRHRMIHRDIKPDNFLISASGHLKIADFGLAFDGHWSHDASYYSCQRYSLLQRFGIKVDGDSEDQKKCEGIATQLPWLQSMREVLQRHEKPSETRDLPRLLGWRNRCGNRATAHSVVGTSQYMAPEVIQAVRGAEYDGRCDWPLVSDRCKDLMYHLIQDKEFRLCSKRYKMKDRSELDQGRKTDCFGRFVFPDDADEIKAHRWFRNLPWDRISTMRPPFVPHIANDEDTRYFEGSDPMDTSTGSSRRDMELTPDQVRATLHEFRPYVQNLAVDLMSAPFDSARLRSADDGIDSTARLTASERMMLKQFIRIYGRKEQKRPRDILLRDESIKDVVLDVRKKTAFIGYTWARRRPCGYM
ncbi:hypothetical protein CP532_6315 [Ophiocordyceps camponoti-leonardi (nom. inval.)]|nr:hypothetical protein CP532_6315 [Ophiocordyceps camponoti-leonardi (nom. inval.)]